VSLENVATFLLFIEKRIIAHRSAATLRKKEDGKTATLIGKRATLTGSE
jgi:hypothetical protein